MLADITSTISFYRFIDCYNQTPELNTEIRYYVLTCNPVITSIMQMLYGLKNQT